MKIMRSLTKTMAGAVGLFALPLPVVAQQSSAQATGSIAPADPAVQLAAMRQQFVSAQQEIVRLRAEVAAQRDQAAALTQCRDKNGRLVSIGNELIAGYQKRYRRGQFLPFDTGRRKFEAELQDVGGRIYDNRIDAGQRRAEPPATGAATPGSTPPRDTK